jgi:hypothetical protein
MEFYLDFIFPTIFLLCALAVAGIGITLAIGKMSNSSIGSIPIDSTNNAENSTNNAENSTNNAENSILSALSALSVYYS